MILDREGGVVDRLAIVDYKTANDSKQDSFFEFQLAILPRPAVAKAWIAPGDDKDKLKDLLRPFSPARLAYCAVDTAVGNVRNNSPDCINPI